MIQIFMALMCSLKAIRDMNMYFRTSRRMRQLIFVTLAVVHLNFITLIKAGVNHAQPYISTFLDLDLEKLFHSFPLSIRLVLTDVIVEAQLYVRMIFDLERGLDIAQIDPDQKA